MPRVSPRFAPLAIAALGVALLTIGWLLGLQVLFDGITMLVYGRLIVTVTSTQPVT